ncbi:hypothetical protein AAG906_011604 [Vitis piasezkii]
MKTKTLGGSLYFVTFIDDHSRNISVYTLKTKDQVLDVFKQFHVLIERQSSEKLKCIRTDNGGEYFGPFDEYCRQHGIQHQKTPPKTPQLNGLAGRMNRTLIERNLMFRIEFGQIMKSLMITCVSLDRSKLDAKTRPCVFIGYGQDELGYRFYDPVQKKIVDDDVHEQSPTEAPSDVPLRRYTRDRHPSTRYSVDDYMKSLHENHSFELVKLPKEKRALKNRWVYRVKQEEHTSQPHYKVRLVIKGFNQKKYVIYLCGFGLDTSLDLEIHLYGLKRAEAMKFSNDDFVILLLYVDDILIVGRNVSRIDSLKKQLSKSFAMKDLGPVKRILVETHFWRWETNTCWIADSDMAEDVDNRRSTSGYLMTFSGGVVSWQSRLQKCVALSTTEAEYIAAAEACKELLFKQQCYVVYYDNQSAIHLSKNSTYHARSKHIDARYHWMRDALNDNLFEIEKIYTKNNGSDMLTKTLPREKLGVFCSIAGMVSPST